MRSRRIVAAAVVLAVAAPSAHAQLPESFESGIPAGWTSGFGAPPQQVAAAGFIPAADGNFFALLRSHFCTGGVGCPDNIIQDGGGTWNYLPYDGAGLPTSTTGSVALSPSFTLPGTATFSIALNFLYNPVDLGSDANFNARNRDWALVRLFEGTNVVDQLFFQVQEDQTVAVSRNGGAPTILSGSAAAGDFAQQTAWQTYTTTLNAGTYSFEFGVADQQDKLDEAALGIDNVSVVGINAVPEPASWTLIAMGLAALVFVANRRRA